MKKKVFNSFELQDIKEISIIDTDTFREFADIIPKSFAWWWARQGNGSCAVVYGDGHLDDNLWACGIYVSIKRVSVRPLFILETEPLMPGEKVFVGDLLCTVLRRNVVLSDLPVTNHVFNGCVEDDEPENNWDTCSLKRYIESDEFLALCGLKEGGCCNEN